MIWISVLKKNKDMDNYYFFGVKEGPRPEMDNYYKLKKKAENQVTL